MAQLLQIDGAQLPAGSDTLGADTHLSLPGI